MCWANQFSKNGGGPRKNPELKPLTFRHPFRGLKAPAPSGNLVG